MVPADSECSENASERLLGILQGPLDRKKGKEEYQCGLFIRTEEWPLTEGDFLQDTWRGKKDWKQVSEPEVPLHRPACNSSSCV